MSSDGFGPVKTTGRVDHRRRARRLVLYVVKMLTYCESAWAIDGSFHVNTIYILTICAHECNWCGLRSVTLESCCVGAIFSRYVLCAFSTLDVVCFVKSCVWIILNDVPCYYLHVCVKFVVFCVEFGMV
jgi:hypothetical protein